MFEHSMTRYEVKKALKIFCYEYSCFVDMVQHHYPELGAERQDNED